MPESETPASDNQSAVPTAANAETTPPMPSPAADDWQPAADNPLYGPAVVALLVEVNVMIFYALSVALRHLGGIAVVIILATLLSGLESVACVASAFKIKHQRWLFVILWLILGLFSGAATLHFAAHLPQR